MPIIWREELSVGNEEIDMDHKHLISLINTIEEDINGHVPVDALKMSSGQLMSYTKGHFEREQKLQVNIQFPFRDAHKQEHENLIQRLDSINKKFDSYLGFDSLMADQAEKQQISELTETFRDWLMKHIMTEDMKMKSYFVQE